MWSHEVMKFLMVIIKKKMGIDQIKISTYTRVYVTICKIISIIVYVTICKIISIIIFKDIS